MESRKFYWGKVTLTNGDGEAVPDIKALIYGDSGLCINQYNPNKPQGKFTTVSHINSGKRITDGFYTYQSARWFCEAISGLINWNEIGPTGEVHKRWPALGAEIREIRQLVTDHKKDWKKALVIYKLNGGYNAAKEKS